MAESGPGGLRKLGLAALAAALTVLLGGCGFQTAGSAEPDRAEPDRAKLARAEPVRAVTGPVVLYGDSLAHESAAFFTLQLGSRVPVRTMTFPGVALCDFADDVVTDTLRAPPGAVVLEFSGNIATPCTARVTRETAAAHYAAEAEALTAFLRSRGVTVFWVSAPRGRPPGPGSPPRQDQFDGNEPYTTAVYRGLVARWRARNEDVWLVDASRAVLHADGSWAERLPCVAADQRCGAGTVPVRAPDGAHFCPSGSVDQSGACSVWSGGAWRFAGAMSDAVRARLGPG